MADNNVKEFLKRFEGQEQKVYKDTKGIPTIGVGSNLESPEMPRIIQEEGLDIDKLKSGDQEMSSDIADRILEKQLAEKRRYLESIKSKDFPDSDIAPNEEEALLSLGYNSPKLWGPDLRGNLQSNDDLAAAKEILLRSNKGDVPGIQRRRLEEARIFAGDNWSNVIDSLNDVEKRKLYNMINSIKSVDTREEVFKEHPFLRPSSRYKKFRAK